MKRVLLILALVVAPLLAQPTPDDQVVARIIRLKYADPQTVASLVRTFGVGAMPDNKMMAIALSGKRGAVEAAETAIKQLDVPGVAQKDIDLTVYFVIGSEQAASAAVGGPIPQEIQSTVATLKQTFPFKNYTLLDVLSLRSRAGAGASVSGQLNDGRTTAFGVRSVTVEPDGVTVRLDRLEAHLRVPKVTGVSPAANKTEYLDSGVSTEIVDVKEGQKLVIGRSSLEGPAKALFLVLIARIAQ